MGLYVAYIDRIDKRKTRDLFYSREGIWYHRPCRKKIESLKDVLDCRGIVSYAEENHLSEYEININEDEKLLTETLEFLANYLLDKDISIGLVLTNLSLLEKHEGQILSLGISYSVWKPSPKPLEPESLPDVSSRKLFKKSQPKTNINAFGCIHAEAEMFLDVPPLLNKSPRKEPPQFKLDESFHTKLMKHLIESKKTNAEVYRQGGISRQLFSRIISDEDYLPTKPTIFSLIIGLELRYFEAVELLESAGYAFSKSLQMDVVVARFIKAENYDLDAMNMELNERGCPLLGWHPRD